MSYHDDQKPEIINPVLSGFNPDPSFIRVDQDYYLATSTFEWYPGVQIHHSSDLVNWTLVSRPLNRESLLDMRGNPDSCGIWAPCLSYADGLFWLVYTNVKRLDGAFKDTPNFITTCETIDGIWSDPVFVNSSGFDPSLFHDDDGLKYFVNQRWNHRGSGTGGNPAHDSFDGIALQEWSPAGGLSGSEYTIFMGTERGLTEAPHLFKRNGWYYLTVAEGGTGYEHAVSMARSRNIAGPYEPHPDKHLFCVEDLSHPIQRTGHGQYVETHWGDCYHSFLMGRPLFNSKGNSFCPMGRESGLERCYWDDDWLYAESGRMPRVRVPAPDAIVDNKVPNSKTTKAETCHLFDKPELPPEFQWLRTPESSRIFKAGRNGLVLFGRESVGSWFEQSLVARRQEHHQYSAETALTFNPLNYQQAAGLTTYYNRHKFHALLLTHDPSIGRSLIIMSCEGDYPDSALTFPMTAPCKVTDEQKPLEMKVTVNGLVQQFFWRSEGERNWRSIGPELDASYISDEGGRGEHASFTGAFCGMIAFDQTGQALPSTFKYFNYFANPSL